MVSVDKQILEILSRKRAATALELSRTLGVTKPAVHYHIKRLIERGQVETAATSHTGARPGRPVKLYQLASTRWPDHYYGLCEALLNTATIPEDHSADTQQTQAIARALLPVALPSAGLPFIKRMAITMELLETMHYLPHWEVRAAGAWVELRNCPYARLSVHHPMLCEVDRDMLEILLEVPIRLETSWRQTPSQPPVCRFSFSR